VFHETLRLRNPSWINSRLAEEDITVNGLFIPKVG
jgi:cytochrome P450